MIAIASLCYNMILFYLYLHTLAFVIIIIIILLYVGVFGIRAKHVYI